MPRLRRVLGPLVAVWLVCQAGTGAFAWMAAGDDCGCPHTSGICPMHSGATGKMKRAKDCGMRAIDTSAATSAIASLLGPIAPIPAIVTSAPMTVSVRASAADPAADGLRPVPPDPPPPRA